VTSAGGNVTIRANGPTTGGAFGIGATTAASGNVVVIVTDDTTGGSVNGINTFAVDGATLVIVDDGADVTGGQDGINVTTTGAAGTAQISVVIVEDLANPDDSIVRGTADAGIEIAQTGATDAPVDLVIFGVVDGGVNGIRSVQLGTGVTTLVNNSLIGGGTGAAVDLLSNGGILIDNDAVIAGNDLGVTSPADLANLAIADFDLDALAIVTRGAGPATIDNDGFVLGPVEMRQAGPSLFLNDGIFASSGASLFNSAISNALTNNAGLIAVGDTDLVFNPLAVNLVTNNDLVQVLDSASGATGDLSFEGGLGLDFLNNGRISMQNNLALQGQVEGTPTNFVRISGDYAGGAGSQLGVDAELGGPGSTADMLIIGGNATGTTSIIVNDVDEGRGAFNPDGIVIVTVGGTTNDNFALDPTSEHYDPDRDVLDKGLFFYDLVQDGNVYKLVGLPDADAFDVPVLATGALTIWNETALGWVDRQSDIRSWYWRGQYRVGFAAGAGADLPVRQAAPMAAAPVALPAAGPGIWAKAIGSWTDRDGKATTGAFGTSFGFDTSYKQDVFSIQGGVDFGRESVLAPGDVWVFGLMGGFITSELDFARSPTRATYEGGTVGLSTTYLSGGFFWDTLWKVDFLDVNVRFPSFAASDSTDVVTYGSLTNVGYRFDVGSFFLEPSATFSWARADMDNLTVGAVTTSFSDVESIRGALGLRVGAGLLETAAMRVEGSLLGRIWNEFSGEAKAHFLDVGDALALTDSFEGTFGEVKAGLDIFSKGSGWGGFVNGSVKFNDDFTTTTVKGGIRYQW
jgi:outer membrane autotransporter protein